MVLTAFIHDGVGPSTKELTGKIETKKEMRAQRLDNLPVPPSVSREKGDTLPVPQGGLQGAGEGFLTRTWSGNSLELKEVLGCTMFWKRDRP